jgi:hypothetical protein
MKRQGLFLTTLALILGIGVTVGVPATAPAQDLIDPWPDTGPLPRVWTVPGDAPSLMAALEAVGPGDVIELASGRHLVTGSGHALPPGVVIRGVATSPDLTVIEEGIVPGAYRTEPVFLVDRGSRAHAGARFEDLTFRDFNQGCYPNIPTVQPIIQVESGALVLERCVFDQYQGTAARFLGGAGLLEACVFRGGHGQPTVVDFQGAHLQIRDCFVRENTTRRPGDFQDPTDPREASVIKIRSGSVRWSCNEFCDNGPASYLVDIDAGARVEAVSCQMSPNALIRDGRVAGTLILTQCSPIDMDRWDVIPPGEIIIIATDITSKAAVHNHTLSAVKALFD